LASLQPDQLILNRIVPGVGSQKRAEGGDERTLQAFAPRKPSMRADHDPVVGSTFIHPAAMQHREVPRVFADERTVLGSRGLEDVVV